MLPIYDTIQTPDVYHINQDIMIYQGAGIQAPGIVLDTISACVINQGEITTASIDISDNRQLEIVNSGNIDGVFNIGNHATLIQTISTTYQIKPLDIGTMNDKAKYVLNITRGDVLSWDSIMDISYEATKIVLNDAKLKMDPGVLTNISGSNIELNGNIIIYVDSVESIGNKPLFSDVINNGKVFIIETNSDSIYAVETYVDGGAVYIRQVRNTNYSEILHNDKLGGILDDMRNKGIHGKLLSALDNAQSRAQISDIMSRSVVFHPIRLMQPIRILDNFNMFGDLRNIRETGISGTPFYIHNSDFDLYGIKGDVNFRLSDNINLYAAPNFSKLIYSDDINEFNSYIYGATFGALYDNGNIVANVRIGGEIAKFNVGPVLDKGEIKNNPAGLSLYGAADIGYRFNLYDDINVVPFVGGVAEHTSVLSDKNNKFAPYVGANLVMPMHTENIHYDYGLRWVTQTSGDTDLSIHATVLSVFDGVGADAGLGIIYNHDMGNSVYAKISGYIEF